MNCDAFSLAVTPNWGMQGTQSHSSSFHHVSISLCIECRSHQPSRDTNSEHNATSIRGKGFPVVTPSVICLNFQIGANKKFTSSSLGLPMIISTVDQLFSR